MIPAEIPQNEAKRIEVLRGLDILDTAPEERFDRLVRIVCRCLDVPMALISLVDEKRQWFKASLGLAVQETPRNQSFCAHAILQEKVFHIPNALEDPRFVGNPLVTNDPGIRMYAGHPIHSKEMRIGTLCVLDRNPRVLSKEDLQLLKDIAGLVELEIRLREAERRTASLAKESKDLSSKLQEQEAIAASLKKLVLLDPELHIPNSFYYAIFVPQEIQRGTHSHKPIGYIGCAIDNFAEYERNTSKVTSVETLKRIADVMTKIPKWPRGLTFRMEKDRFLIVLPEKGINAVREMADAIVDGVHRLRIPYNNDPNKRITVSLGIGEYNRPFPEPGDIVEEIWKTVHLAKLQGGNRIKQIPL